MKNKYYCGKRKIPRNIKKVLLKEENVDALQDKPVGFRFKALNQSPA